MGKLMENGRIFNLTFKLISIYFIEFHKEFPLSTQTDQRTIESEFTSGHIQSLFGNFPTTSNLSVAQTEIHRSKVIKGAAERVSDLLP